MSSEKLPVTGPEARTPAARIARRKAVDVAPGPADDDPSGPPSAESDDLTPGDARPADDLTPKDAGPADDVTPGDARPADDDRSPTPDRRDSRQSRQRAGSRRRVWAGLVAAAAVLAVGGGLATWGTVQLDRSREAQDLADLSLAITSDPQAQRATAAVGTGGSVTLVVSGTRAALVARDLLVLDALHGYQVWRVRDNLVTSVALGPSGTTAGAPWVRVVDGVAKGDTIAVSQEPAQGSRKPTGKPIAALRI